MHDSIKAGDPKDIALGTSLIAKGKVGCILLAGGDGSRLGWGGPKGTFPISLVKQKPLFQLFMERVQAASTYFDRELSVAIMTSPLNHEITRESLPPGAELFEQRLIPLLDENRNPLAEKRPNGNGEVFHRFIETGLCEKWKKQGIEFIQVVLIDNPLADPFDPNQIGIHARQKAEVTLKAVLKKEGENVGVIGKKGGKWSIVEYSENPPENWPLANTSLFSFHIDFIETIQKASLPIHVVKKFIDGRPVYKQETFIFDLIAFAERIEVILYPREATFAPLKHRDDVGPVQRALLDRDRHVFVQLSGCEVAEQIFELDPAFHYPTTALKAKWRGQPLPKSSYIQP